MCFRLAERQAQAANASAVPLLGCRVLCLTVNHALLSTRILKARDGLFTRVGGHQTFASSSLPAHTSAPCCGSSGEGTPGGE